MDLATLIGMVGAIGFIVMAMIIGSAGDPGMFGDLVSLLYCAWWFGFCGAVEVYISRFLGRW